MKPTKKVIQSLNYIQRLCQNIIAHPNNLYFRKVTLEDHEMRHLIYPSLECRAILETLMFEEQSTRDGHVIFRLESNKPDLLLLNTCVELIEEEVYSLYRPKMQRELVAKKFRHSTAVRNKNDISRVMKEERSKEHN